MEMLLTICHLARVQKMIEQSPPLENGLNNKLETSYEKSTIN